MAKLLRVFQKQFGVNAGNSDVGIFGSLAAADPQYSKDPEDIQSLNAFLTGWAAETIANNRPALEDFNAVDFLTFYQLCYLLQTGVPEWDASTTYYIGSIVQDGTGGLYKSLADDNLNNALTDDTKWESVSYVPSAENALAGSVLQEVVTLDQTARSITAAAFPADNSKPQKTEGAAYAQMETVFTPKLADSKIIVEGIFQVSQPGGSPGTQITALGLWKGDEDDCLAVGANRQAYDDGGSGYEAAGCTKPVRFIYSFVPGSIAAITFKVRVGALTGTAYINSDITNLTYGNTMCSALKITEVKA